MLLPQQPFNALLSVAILTTRSSPKSRAIDCMPIPILAPSTLPTYSASPEDKAGADCVAVWHPDAMLSNHCHYASYALAIGLVTCPIRICEDVDQTHWSLTKVFLNPSSVRLQIPRSSRQSVPMSCRGLGHATCQSIRTKLHMRKICTQKKKANLITHDVYSVTLDFSSSVSSWYVPHFSPGVLMPLIFVPSSPKCSSNSSTCPRPGS